MADKFRSAIARVYRIGDSKGTKHRKHAMLWLFQAFALTAGLYGCQVWATSSLKEKERKRKDSAGSDDTARMIQGPLLL